MPQSESANLAASHYVDDLPGSLQIGARLHGILARIGAGAQLNQAGKDYLRTSGLNCLLALAEGQLSPDDFRREAAAEQVQRVIATSSAAAEAAASRAKEAAERAAASAAIFKDPEFLRRQEARQLRRRFSVGYVEPQMYSRVMKLLRLLADGQRLHGEDAAWFQTEAEYCWTQAVEKTWHLLEAKALTATWRTSGKPWFAIYASGHWRKAGQAARSLSLTNEALALAKSREVRSALLTTRGGALRDVGKLVDAKAAGEQAHQLTPQDYRPCTLLGAVCLEMHDLAAGHEWFMKAELRGASKRSIDHDIRALLARACPASRGRILSFLVEHDPERFAWLNQKPCRLGGQARLGPSSR